ITVEVGQGLPIGASVAVVLAENTIDNTVTAFTTRSTVSSASGGNVTIDAESDRTIKADAASVAAAVTISAADVPISVGATGVGLRVVNTIKGATSSSIGSGKVDGAGDVTVDAVDRSTLNSNMTSVGFNAALVGGTVVVARAENDIENDLKANIGVA